MQSQAITLAVAPFVGLMSSASAATTFIDDFSSGGYPATGATVHADISSPFADTRVTSSTAFVWQSSVNVSTGNLTFTLNARSDPSPDHFFSMVYSNSWGNLNLAGYDAFVIHAESLSGSGQILAHFGPNGPTSTVIPVNLTGTGDVVIPFSNLGVWTSPHPLTAIGFQIFPENRDFSITLSGISVIPEPSAVALSGFGLAMLAARRQRK